MIHAENLYKYMGRCNKNIKLNNVETLRRSHKYIIYDKTDTPPTSILNIKYRPTIENDLFGLYRKAI